MNNIFRNITEEKENYKKEYYKGYTNEKVIHFSFEVMFNILQWQLFVKMIVVIKVKMVNKIIIMMNLAV